MQLPPTSNILIVVKGCFNFVVYLECQTRYGTVMVECCTPACYMSIPSPASHGLLMVSMTVYNSFYFTLVVAYLGWMIEVQV